MYIKDKVIKTKVQKPSQSFQNSNLFEKEILEENYNLMSSKFLNSQANSSIGDLACITEITEPAIENVEKVRQINYSILSELKPSENDKCGIVEDNQDHEMSGVYPNLLRPYNNWSVTQDTSATEQTPKSSQKPKRPIQFMKIENDSNRLATQSIRNRRVRQVYSPQQQPVKTNQCDQSVQSDQQNQLKASCDLNQSQKTWFFTPNEIPKKAFDLTTCKKVLPSIDFHSSMSPLSSQALKNPVEDPKLTQLPLDLFTPQPLKLDQAARVKNNGFLVQNSVPKNHLIRPRELKKKPVPLVGHKNPVFYVIKEVPYAKTDSSPKSNDQEGLPTSPRNTIPLFSNELIRQSETLEIIEIPCDDAKDDADCVVQYSSQTVSPRGHNSNKTNITIASATIGGAPVGGNITNPASPKKSFLVEFLKNRNNKKNGIIDTTKRRQINLNGQNCKDCPEIKQILGSQNGRLVVKKQTRIPTQVILDEKDMF